MSFDEAMKRLEVISKEMDNKELPLEKAVELYSEAAALVETCRKEIADAKLKIEKIENGGADK
ncbi:MAG: exodeoxyribonuclease VII small subunit [Ruminiclostridium sp.]|nr:exodeoxyribonuclease VII small subunit [Ruminiclostridium sp.]